MAKCGDCRYFVKAPLLSSHCSYKRSMNYRNGDDIVFPNEAACNRFQSAEFCCRDCAYCHSEWCEKKGSVSYTDPACSAFFRKGDNGPDKEGCFLTSACVSYQGKPDDCAELTALRAFRDGYMMKTEEGKALVEEYYRIAPAIVEKIDASPRREEYYAYISSVIDNCVALIGQGRNEETLEAYTGMVRRLREELAPNG